MILQVDPYLLVLHDVCLQFHYKKDSNLFQPHLYLYSLFLISILYCSKYTLYYIGLYFLPIRVLFLVSFSVF